MLVRAVAAAMAVWCVSSAAFAAAYTETWNPPEASKHSAKAVKGQKRVVVAQKHGAVSSKAGVRKVVLASKKGVKPTKGKVQKVVAKGAAKGSVRPMAAAQAKKGAPKIAHANTGKAKLAQAHPVRPNVIKVAAKTGGAKPAVAVPATHAAPAAPTANMSANPAVANSGSLPPILK